MSYHNESLSAALINLFPELNLKERGFATDKGELLLLLLFILFLLIFQPPAAWGSLARQRNFFDEFASTNQFDPLDVEKWYYVTHKEIVTAVSYLCS